MKRALRTARETSPWVQSIGRAATLALYDELALSPKPGLVTLVDRGSHRDMDAQTFIRSLLALRSYFVDIAGLGAAGADLSALRQRGVQAERDMLRATGGVNTHRGAVFMLGLLCAAAGAVLADGAPLHPEAVRQELVGRWGRELAERAKQPSALPGGIAARRYGLRGAAAEAAAGFPGLFEMAVPGLRRARARRLPRDAALLDTLFHVMSVLDDSNLAHRGGLEGLRYAQQAAREFLQAGGSARSGAAAEAARIGEQFVRRNLSPGGAADTLSAACWMQRLGMLE
jgi:triphosphoribosyl-dephospho-CoA synthase